MNVAARSPAREKFKAADRCWPIDRPLSPFQPFLSAEIRQINRRYRRYFCEPDVPARLDASGLIPRLSGETRKTTNPTILSQVAPAAGAGLPATLSRGNGPAEYRARSWRIGESRRRGFTRARLRNVRVEYYIYTRTSSLNRYNVDAVCISGFDYHPLFLRSLAFYAPVSRCCEQRKYRISRNCASAASGKVSRRPAIIAMTTWKGDTRRRSRSAISRS